MKRKKFFRKSSDFQQGHWRAGASIRALAETRRTKSILYLAAAIGIGMVVVLGGLALSGSFRVVILIVCGVAVMIAGRSHHWRVRFHQAAKGAKAEEEIAAKLLPLLQRGWTLKFNQCVPKYGDVDILCVSPQGNLIAVDVKAHKGTVRYQSGRLEIVVNSAKKSSFGGRNVLLQCRGQAEAMQRQRRKRVYPMLCFANAVVERPNSVIEGVEIVSGATILERLQWLDQQMTLESATSYS